MKRLNVLFVTAWYPHHDNPVSGVFVREHAQAVRLYDDVVVVHAMGKTRGLDRLWSLTQASDSFLTEDIPTYVLRHRYSPIPKTTRVLGYFSMLWAYRTLVRQGFRPDILHVHVHKAALPALLIGRLHGLPVVITEHHSAFPRRLLDALDLREARLAFPRADRVLPVSRALEQGIIDYGIHARFEVVPNAVQTTQFQFMPRTKGVKGAVRMLCVANMPQSGVKGIDCLLEAIAGLHGERSDWRLDIVGDGPLRTTYEQRAHELNLADRVTFHGRLAKSDVAAFMQQADFFVLPSHWENMPCVLIEAMASGLPIVASAVGGIPDMIDSRMGRLVRPGDAADLQAALRMMLDHVDDYDRALIAAEADRRYSQASVGRRLDAIYRECLGESIHKAA